MSGPAAEQRRTCDATIEDDNGSLRRCQHDDGHYPATRHRSELHGGREFMEWIDDAQFSTPASSSPPRAVVRPSRYTVTCVPADAAPDAHVWALQVEEKRDGSWVVTDGFGYLNPGLVFEDRPYPQCLFNLDAALALAKEAAPLVIINGRTVTRALELADAWRAQKAADALARSKEQ